MTSEIAIMNQTAIALAADSAVTVTGKDRQKVHNTANKLFAQSDSVITFLRGIEPSLEGFLKKYFIKYFNDFPLTLIESLSSLETQEKRSLIDTLKTYADDSLEMFNNQWCGF